ncbi:hypothetical protein AB0F43_21855 [Kribbella sp. NPDC023972]|uniref:hypothetical protein n=1 Tax=Kribbella sp. NPDC023972 TaxID=3154795 RepID=UPI00340471F7
MMRAKKKARASGMRRTGWVLVGAGAAGAGAVGYRVLRRKAAGAAGEMFAQGQVPGSVVESEGDAEAAPAEERMTANERADGVRRTGDDRLVHPVAAGETDPVAAADPTVAPDTPPGRPTGGD